MKKINILYGILLLLIGSSCYKDLGNYDYHPINELEVDSLRSSYSCDMYDTLRISPILKGSMYSDTSRFTYSWEIGGEVLATTHDLNIQMNLDPGLKYSRYIVMDKVTKIKKYSEFSVNVSSSTAGDMILVLSKFQGRAELSYLRLDKPSDWKVNFYQNNAEEGLGSNPKQISVSYLELDSYHPFVNKFGRVMILVDNKIKLLDKSTLKLDTLTPELTGEAYLKEVSFPKPDINGYKPEFISESADNVWRFNVYGWQQSVVNAQISGGALYVARMGHLAHEYHANSKSPLNGYLSPFGYWDNMRHTTSTKPGSDPGIGYEVGSYIMFDQGVGQFVFSDKAGNKVVATDKADIPAYPGYTLLWGSATSGDNSLAILTKDNTCKMLQLQDGTSPATQKATKLLVKEISGGNVMSSSSKFYLTKYSDYLFFSNNNKLYKYNLNDMLTGYVVPNEGHKILDLSEYGYDETAKITDICVSRSEKTLLIGVSRYGEDTEGQGDEAKGDILYFDLEASNGQITYNEAKSQKGISGIPVDIEIKYQTYWRDGKNLEGVLVDNI